MKGWSAVFGTVVGVFVVALLVCNSARCGAAESGFVGSEGLSRPPEVRWFDGLTEWAYQGEGERHLSCKDAGKGEPTLIPDFEMSALFGQDPDNRTDVLARKVAKILAAHGWKKCRTEYSEFGPPVDTYSNGQGLMEVTSGYSQSIGGTLDIRIGEEAMKPAPRRRRQKEVCLRCKKPNP
jgi:hypothetical protein